MHLKHTIIPALLSAILVATSARAQDTEPTPATSDSATAGATADASDRGPASIWMLLPASAGELPDWVEPSAAALNHELAQHAPFLDPGGLRARLERRVSAQPARLSNLQIDAWMSHSRSAIIHLSSMEYAQARQDLLQTEAISARAAEELNREDHRAHAVLETCLYLVRVFVETDQYARAEEHARECRMLVPGLTANALEQTPEVNEVLRHVDEAMRHEPRGQLRVESNPSGCTVRLNGLVFGETPFTLDDMARGDYRLQVECDDHVRGRVHHVRIGDEETVVRVDGRFEQVFETRPIPHLHYPNAEQSREHRMLDALRLAHDGGASHVLLFVPIQDGVRVDRVDVATQTLVASVRVPVNPSAMPPIARALVVPVVRALMASRSIDFMVNPPAAIEPWEGPHSKPAIRVSSEQASLAALAVGEPVAEGIMPRRHRRSPSRPRATLGWVIAGAGVAALGLGYALEARSRGLGDRYARAEPVDPDFTSRQGDWQSSRYPVYGLAALGGVGASVGLGLALPARGGVPWYAWLSGAAGVGLVASGVVVGLGASSCGNIASDRVRCVDRGKSVDLAVLLAMTGAPLLSVPLSYLLLPTGSRFSARLDLGRTHASVMLEGRL
ncbi:MAG: PEGA domain-containing protein [Deltaproteobacteria bacterium]|nr:PEGA domain-containing protein [Deltaproteobacteria bacterium]